MKRVVTCSIFLFALVASLVAQIPASKHVYIVAEENHSYEHLVGSSSMPYLNSVLSNGALSTQFYANQHTSLADYFWVTAGQMVTTNSATLLTYNVDNLVRHAMQLGLSYKSYAQSLPYPGFAGLYSGAYMKRHTALPYYSDMGNSQTEMLKHVPITQLVTDIQNNNLPNFAFITPDGDHDLHNCPNGEVPCEQVADAFLKRYIAPLLALPEFQPGGDGLLILWSDEADLNNDNRCSSTVANGCGGHVMVAMIGPNVKKNYRSTNTYRHENLLRTMLMAMGTTHNFPGASENAAPMSDMFVNSPVAPPVPPPTAARNVTIATPASGATVSNSMPISATASGPSPVTAMRVYVDNALRASSSGNAISATIALAAGSHSVTAQSWDSTGTVTKRSINVTAVNGTPAAAGIVISSPTSGATTTASVHVTATSSMVGIVATAVYLDNTLSRMTASTSVDTYLTTTAGTHNLVIQNWDSKGSVTKSAVSFNAKK